MAPVRSICYQVIPAMPALYYLVLLVLMSAFKSAGILLMTSRRLLASQVKLIAVIPNQTDESF